MKSWKTIAWVVIISLIACSQALSFDSKVVMRLLELKLLPLSLFLISFYLLFHWSKLQGVLPPQQSLVLQTHSGFGVKPLIAIELNHTVNHPAGKILSNFVSRASEAADGGETHLLIVDNDPVNLQDMVQILSSNKIRITMMTHGEEVLVQLAKHKPDWDLVILEADLPHISGYDVCRKLREYYTLFELPILMLTAGSQAGHSIKGFEAGANDNARKPVNGAELKVRVDTLLKMKTSVIHHIRMETSLLQAQIKPHFLYNTLNTIASLGEEDSNLMRELLMEFGDYLRASFDFANLNKFVPFEKEMRLLHSYLYIEKVRFAERLLVEFDIPAHLHFMIPPLTLQPIVENAVRHGIMKRMEGGLIRITAQDLGEAIVVSVLDNGIGFTADEISTILSGNNVNRGIGLFNINRRLKHCLGYGLTIESTPRQGTKVSIRIPKTAAAG